HFTGWSEAYAGDSDVLLSEAAALQALLERAHAARRWAQVIRLGRAVESAYALGQRWQAWGRVLELVLDAARRSEDLEAEGWARHQLGTRAYGLGRVDEARTGLQEALALRERIGDSAGAAATRQNLSVVAGRAPLLYRLSHLSLAVVAIVCALLIGAASVAGAEILSDGNTAPDDASVTVPEDDDNNGGARGSERRTLTVGVRGEGVVVSDDASIRCAKPRCRTQLALNRKVLLRARPQRGSEFARWNGACSGRSACRLVLTADTHVVALFKPVRDPRDVTVTVRGKGKVVSHPAGIACGADAQCQATFTRSRAVQLTAAAARGHRFAGWSGDCDGAARCVISNDSRRTTVGARFVADPEAVTLTVDMRGTGLGRVTSRPSGIDCGELCIASFARGSVILTAVAQPGSTFAGWNDGRCQTTTRNSCTVTLNRSRVVVTSFNTATPPPPPDPSRPPQPAPPPPPPPPRFPLTVNIDGDGKVSSDPTGIDSCASDCEYAFPAGTEVRLRPSPLEGSLFSGWAGDCSASDACVLRMDRPRSVTATFARGATLTIDNPPIEYARVWAPRGTAKIEPAGIACRQARCEHTFKIGTRVKLDAEADPNWAFQRWEGLEDKCSLWKAPCEFNLTSDRQATVVFILAPG
ncbi:MAG: hypothetical protein M3N47_08790, partial [Chloroflexota bacterium]|nr:hypothetical protein [Chloroflexota bacterium]